MLKLPACTNNAFIRIIAMNPTSVCINATLLADGDGYMR